MTQIGLALLFAAQTLALLFIGQFAGSTTAFIAVVAIPVAGLLPIALDQMWAKVTALLSWLRWWHVAWLLLALGSLSFRTRDILEIQDSPLDAFAAMRVGITASAIILLGIKAKVDVLSSAATRGIVGAAFAFAGMSISSTIWSIYPPWTAYKSIEFLTDLAVVAVMITEIHNFDSLKKLFDWTWTILAVLMLNLWIGAVLWPVEALNRGVGLLGIQLQGVIPSISSNGVGDMSATLTIVTLNRLLSDHEHSERRLAYGFLLAISIVTMMFAQTRSALMACIVSVVLVMLAWRRFLITFIFGSLAGIVALFFHDAAVNYVMRDQNTEMFMSLTGRVTWWTAAWQAIVDRPILGYGAYAGARFAAFASISNNTTSTIHNTYLEILLGTGALGLIIFAIVLFRTYYWTLASTLRAPPGSTQKLLAIESLGVLTMLIGRSFFTSNMIWHGSLDFLVVVVFAEIVRLKTAERGYEVPIRSRAVTRRQFRVA